VNCYRIHQKSLNFIYPFKFYSNFTNKNVSWLHFSWATQYIVYGRETHSNINKPNKEKSNINNLFNLGFIEVISSPQIGLKGVIQVLTTKRNN